jgi:hypothetical protein
LTEYADLWNIKFNLDKSAVLCCNAPPPPPTWPLSRGTIRSSNSEKYLTNIFQTTLQWQDHVDNKLHKAEEALEALIRKKLLGPPNGAKQASAVVHAKLWPTLDVGRATINLFLPQHAALQADYESFQSRVANLVLGTTSSCPPLHTLGELGWLSDRHRGSITLLGFFKGLVQAPEHSLTKKVIRAVLEDSRDNPDNTPPIINHVTHTATEHNINLGEIQNKSWKKQVRRMIHKVAQQQWKLEVSTHQHLSLIYTHNPTLRMQPYLQMPPFRGRLLLTKFRLNDLPLNPTHCPACMLNTTETIIHILLHCTKYNEVRSKHKLDHMTTISQLLLSHRKAQTKQACIDTGHFLADLWNHRCVHTRKPTTAYGILPPFL